MVAGDDTLIAEGTVTLFNGDAGTDTCTYNAAATAIENEGTTIATLFVKTTDDCPNPGQGRCYAGRDFLQNQIASDPGLAQEANWDDVTALVGTMADQIVAGIC